MKLFQNSSSLTQLTSTICRHFVSCPPVWSPHFIFLELWLDFFMGRSLYVEVCHANNIVSVMMSSLFHEIPYRVLDSHSHSKKNVS